MPQLAIRRDGAIAVVSIANPPDGYMDATTVAELDAATGAFERDASLKVVVFAGGLPGVFICHYSVVELEKLARALKARGLSFDPARPAPERILDRVFRRMEHGHLVTIAAIDGHAMGGGFELALACDLRFAGDGTYEIGLPEIKLGILPGAGGTQKLARLVGQARALELTLRGRTLRPGEAAQLGLVHAVCAEGGLARAEAVAREIARQPALAIRHVKQLVRGAHDMPMQEGLALERTLFLDLMVRDEAIERMARMNAERRDIRESDL